MSDVPKHAACGRREAVMRQASGESGGLPWYCWRCRVSFGEPDAIKEDVDTDAIAAALKQALAALGEAFNHISPSMDPVLCIAQGRIETALETIEDALHTVQGP